MSERVKQLLEGACKAVDMRLEFFKLKTLSQKRVWQVVITKGDGGKASIDDCVSTHRQVLSVLQVADLYGDRDEIEVSSTSDDPGAWN